MKRLRTFLLTLVALSLLLLGAAPGGALPPGDGGDGSPADPAGDVLSAVEVHSFTATPRSVAPGESLTISWNVTGAPQLRLNGIVVTGNSKVVTPEARDQRYTLTAHAFGGNRTLGSIIAGIDACAADPAPPDCSSEGHAVIDYSMPERGLPFVYDDKGETTGLIRRTFDPPSWALDLDACGTVPGRHGRVERYDWKLTPPGDGPAITATNTNCKHRLGVPEEGVYRTDLVARTSDGEELTATKYIDVNDVLVVSLGDSMASGEGNPDKQGNYIPLPPPITDSAEWKHHGCHRSAYSGHSRAAEQWEEIDAKTTVSFLSLACSGAKSKQLITSGDNDRDSVHHEPQLEALREVLCRWDCDKKVDVLVVTAGVNDLNFAGLVKRCIEDKFTDVLFFPVTDIDDPFIHGPLCSNGVEDAADVVDDVEESLVSIDAKIDELGIDVGHILLTEYPINMFTDASGNPRAACGVFNMSKGTSADLLDVGIRLNANIERAADRIDRASYVGGIVDSFRGHGYCEDGTWFRGLTESVDVQGDAYGVAHPNHAGQEAIGERIADTYGVPSDRAPVFFPVEDIVTVPLEDLPVFDDPPAPPTTTPPTTTPRPTTPPSLPPMPRKPLPHIDPGRVQEP